MKNNKLKSLLLRLENLESKPSTPDANDFVNVDDSFAMQLIGGLVKNTNGVCSNNNSCVNNATCSGNGGCGSNEACGGNVGCAANESC